jgi:apolipoprotein D and lipocalin family protein
VARVDLERYMGRWYEAARLPNAFQAVCAADTQAEYRLDGQTVRVRNACRREDGSVAEALGVARVVADSGNAKLRVSFFRPFYGDYWILALEENYRWVLVGEPRRRYAWVLARHADLAAAELEAALARASDLGFDRAAFQPTPQRQALE